jgi:hypothetical protein
MSHIEVNLGFGNMHEKLTDESPEWYPMVERRHQAIAAAFREAEAGPR